MNQQKSFILYDNYYEQIVQLSNKDRGTLLLAIFEYRIFGEVRCERNRRNGKHGGDQRKPTRFF